MIADILRDKPHSPIVTELFIRGGKINILFLSHNLISLFQKILD